MVNLALVRLRLAMAWHWGAAGLFWGTLLKAAAGVLEHTPLVVLGIPLAFVSLLAFVFAGLGVLCCPFGDETAVRDALALGAAFSRAAQALVLLPLRLASGALGGLKR